MVIAESVIDRTWPSTEVTWEPSGPKLSECAASVRENLTVALAGATVNEVGAYVEHAATRNENPTTTVTTFIQPDMAVPSHPKPCWADRSGFSSR
jgi:hypothetical protein